MKRFLIPFSVTFFVVAADLLTKRWTERALAASPIEVLGDWFRLRLGFNRGVAFGMLSDHGLWPLVLTGAILLAVAIWIGAAIRTGSLTGTAVWAISFIAAGGLANFLDRLPDGRVTDFLDFGVGASRWPAFNLADCFVVSGVMLLLFTSFAGQQNAATKQGNKR